MSRLDSLISFRSLFVILVSPDHRIMFGLSMIYMSAKMGLYGDLITSVHTRLT